MLDDVALYQNEIFVEVLFNNAFYCEASVEDLQDDYMVVRLSNGTATTPKYTDSRLLPKMQTTFEPVAGDELELCMEVPNSNITGWVKCLVKGVEATYYTVEVVIDGKTQTRHVVKEELRVPNENPPLNQTQIFKYEIKIPKDLQDFAKRNDAHSTLKIFLGIDSVLKYNESTGKLLIITLTEYRERSLSLIKKIHLRGLRQKSILLRNIDKTAEFFRKVQSDTHMYIHIVDVPEGLMKYLLTSQANLVNKASSLEGIQLIKIYEQTNCIVIIGTDAEATQKARDMVEIDVETIAIPVHLIGQVCGKHSHLVQEIADRCQVTIVITERDTDPKEDIDLELIGTQESIEHAKAFLWFHLQNLKEMKVRVVKTQQLTEQLARLSTKLTANVLSESTTDSAQGQESNDKTKEMLQKAPLIFKRVIVGRRRSKTHDQLKSTTNREANDSINSGCSSNAFKSRASVSNSPRYRTKPPHQRTQSRGRNENTTDGMRISEGNNRDSNNSEQCAYSEFKGPVFLRWRARGKVCERTRGRDKRPSLSTIRNGNKKKVVDIAREGSVKEDTLSKTV